MDERIIAGLEQAIRAETEGHHFYLMAARATSDEKGVEIFELLAKEELDHLRFLTHQKRSLVETGQLDSNVQLGPQADLSGPSPIFSDSLRERAAEAHFEMSALSIGIQLEINAEKHYQAQADATDAPEVKAFFEKLARWEGGHYQALLRQHDSLKEDYWAAGGFAPF